MSFIEGTKDFIFHPYNWTAYYFKNFYNTLNGISFINIIHFSFNIVNGFFSFIGYISYALKIILDFSSDLSLAFVLGTISWISLQFFLWSHEIVTLATSFVAATPNIPEIVAIGVSFFYLRVLDPVMTILDDGGSNLEVFLALLPTESQIMNWSSHIVHVININYQIAWSNAACSFIDLFSIPQLKLFGFSLDITGFLARRIIDICNPIFGVGISTVLDKIARIFL